MRTPPRDDNRSRTILVLLVLAALSIVSLDAGLGDDSPVKPVRTAAGNVLAPVQTGLSVATRPVKSIGELFRSDDDLREDNEDLQDENDELRAQLRTAGVDQRRMDEYENIDKVTGQAGFERVDANVVGIGGAQSFARTVTIDAGSSAGVEENMTVLNADGLVGRVVSVTRYNATVLLIVDAESTVGGRLGSTMELGFLDGDGDLSGDARLTMSAIDTTELPKEGDSVVTWGSQDGAPYVAGVPIGEVRDAEESPRDQSATASIEPYVDFSSLDIVSVVTGSAGDEETQAKGD